MNNKVPLTPTKDCDTKSCPFMIGETGYPKPCRSKCIAWTVVVKETSREDHSGGGDMIRSQGYKYGIEAKRKGPGGCMGYWEIPELGYCKRLWPTLDVVSITDYEDNK